MTSSTPRATEATRAAMLGLGVSDIGPDARHARRMTYGTVEVGPSNSAGCVVPVSRYSACEIAWHTWKQPVVEVPVAPIVPVFSSIVHISAL